MHETPSRPERADDVAAHLFAIQEALHAVQVLLEQLRRRLADAPFGNP